MYSYILFVFYQNGFLKPRYRNPSTWSVYKPQKTKHFHSDMIDLREKVIYVGFELGSKRYLYNKRFNDTITNCIIPQNVFKNGLSKFFKGWLPQNLLIHSWILRLIYSVLLEFFSLLPCVQNNHILTIYA